MSVIDDLFGRPRAIIAMAHFPPLPGQPLYDGRGGVESILATVQHDVDDLTAAGFDGILFCNEGDRPYRMQAGPETVATMAAVIAEVAPRIDRPFGVDVLWDPIAALALAKATGARFVREVFTGAYAGDFGIWNTDPAAALRFRRQIDADGVRLFFNITAEFAAPVAAREIGLAARSAVLSSLADAVCVSGSVTGSAADLTAIARAKEAVPDTAVIANTGVTEATVARFLSVADAVIVGTALKEDGVTWNRVDPGRARAFARSAAGSGLWEPRHQPAGIGGR